MVHRAEFGEPVVPEPEPLTVNELVMAKTAIDYTLSEQWQYTDQGLRGFIPPEDVAGLIGAWNALERFHAFIEQRKFRNIEGQEIAY